MDIEKLIEQLKYYGTTYAIGDNLGKEIDGSDELMLNAATALSTLQGENEKLRGEADGMRSNWYKAVEEIKKLRAELERVTAERDALIKRAAGECWACIRRYECNSRKGPHRRCWEFDSWILKED